jgi:hypothetical protein
LSKRLSVCTIQRRWPPGSGKDSTEPVGVKKVRGIAEVGAVDEVAHDEMAVVGLHGRRHADELAHATASTIAAMTKRVR